MSADDATYFMIEEEETSDYAPWYDRCEDPGDGEVPEADEEGGAVGARGREAVGDGQRFLVEGGELADVRQPDEDDDGDGGRVLGEAHAEVAVEEGRPFGRRGEEDGESQGRKSTMARVCPMMLICTRHTLSEPQRDAEALIWDIQP